MKMNLNMLEMMKLAIFLNFIIKKKSVGSTEITSNDGKKLSFKQNQEYDYFLFKYDDTEVSLSLSNLEFLVTIIGIIIDNIGLLSLMSYNDSTDIKPKESKGYSIKDIRHSIDSFFNTKLQSIANAYIFNKVNFHFNFPKTESNISDLDKLYRQYSDKPSKDLFIKLFRTYIDYKLYKDNSENLGFSDKLMNKFEETDIESLYESNFSIKDMVEYIDSNMYSNNNYIKQEVINIKMPNEQPDLVTKISDVLQVNSVEYVLIDYPGFRLSFADKTFTIKWNKIIFSLYIDELIKVNSLLESSDQTLLKLNTGVLTKQPKDDGSIELTFKNDRLEITSETYPTLNISLMASLISKIIKTSPLFYSQESIKIINNSQEASEDTVDIDSWNPYGEDNNSAVKGDSEAVTDLIGFSSLFSVLNATMINDSTQEVCVRYLTDFVNTDNITVLLLKRISDKISDLLKNPVEPEKSIEIHRLVESYKDIPIIKTLFLMAKQSSLANKYIIYTALYLVLLIIENNDYIASQGR
jgi:hypothetical protein